MTAFPLFAAWLFASAGIGSLALTVRMLWQYRDKMAAALLFEPIPKEDAHAPRR
ncbi:MAG: hypothetical protein ABIV36_22545 [Sphingobium limneticum]